MQTCDALIVGGGPAGSSCARRLRGAGLDVLVVDRAAFPRDKVCAGWITPPVLDLLSIDPEEYRAGGRTLQPITGFRTGLLPRASGATPTIDTEYDAPISYGIRRCEFDHYLLERSGARVEAPMPVARIRRVQGGWTVNDIVRAPLLVGAGGHFCPVARTLNTRSGEDVIIGAQEVEFRLTEGQRAACRVEGERPELFFCADLQGYGWCFRKGNYLNVGYGRQDPHTLSAHVTRFVQFLKSTGVLPDLGEPRWHGHAYLLFSSRRRVIVDEGVVLIGDAAGLAYAQSGEGIRPAIESGLMAAGVIIAADGCYDRERLEPYQTQLSGRYEAPAWTSGLARAVPGVVPRSAAIRLLATKWFTRHVLLDRFFLHTHESALQM